MKPLHTMIAGAAAAVLACNTMAQPYGTDEQRARLAQARAESTDERAFDVPTLEVVAPGDYRAAARNDGRLARLVDFHQRLHDHREGVRTAPIDVTSEFSARQEAARQRREQALTRYVAYLHTSPASWLIHQELVGEPGPLALR